jgi:hypothetical protein
MFKYKILQVGNESEGELCHNYATAWQQAINLAKKLIDNNWEPYSMEWLDIKKPLNIILNNDNSDILQIVIARV